MIGVNEVSSEGPMTGVNPMRRLGPVTGASPMSSDVQSASKKYTTLRNAISVNLQYISLKFGILIARIIEHLIPKFDSFILFVPKLSNIYEQK